MKIIYNNKIICPVSLSLSFSLVCTLWSTSFWSGDIKFTKMWEKIAQKGESAEILAVGFSLKIVSRRNWARKTTIAINWVAFCYRKSYPWVPKLSISGCSQTTNLQQTLRRVRRIITNHLRTRFGKREFSAYKIQVFITAYYRSS